MNKLLTATLLFLFCMNPMRDYALTGLNPTDIIVIYHNDLEHCMKYVQNWRENTKAQNDKSIFPFKTIEGKWQQQLKRFQQNHQPGEKVIQIKFAVLNQVNLVTVSLSDADSVAMAVVVFQKIFKDTTDANLKSMVAYIHKNILTKLNQGMKAGNEGPFIAVCKDNQHKNCMCGEGQRSLTLELIEKDCTNILKAPYVFDTFHNDDLHRGIIIEVGEAGSGTFVIQGEMRADSHFDPLPNTINCKKREANLESFFKTLKSRLPL